MCSLRDFVRYVCSAFTMDYIRNLFYIFVLVIKFDKVSFHFLNHFIVILYVTTIFRKFYTPSEWTKKICKNLVTIRSLKRKV